MVCKGKFFSWLNRGHTILLDIGAVCAAKTALVLDYEMISSVNTAQKMRMQRKLRKSWMNITWATVDT